MLREKIADRHEKIADRHDWGLKLVHDGSLEGKPKDPERLDIVLVHGLGGHRETTWTAEDGSYWATNFPPPFTSNLRVFTFGYSGTPRSTGNKETVLSIAENLLELLSDERKQPHLKRRPLIWAGHNLGGNIIKQVLVETERPTSRHHEVYRSTAGVLFFATPHHGLNAKIFQQLILMANKHPRVWFSRNAPSALLDEMDQNDNRINDLLSRFRRVTNHLGFVSLLESALVPGLKDVVVNESSGTLKLPKEEVTKRDAADHIQICKFSNTKNNDPDGNTENNEFGVLAKQVQNFVTISSKAIADWDENRIPLERLGISKIRPKTRPVQPAKGTCESIAKECFNEWSTGAQDNFSSLWVKGPRGCGKAHLAKYMADNWKKEVYDPRTRPQRPAIVAHCSLNDMITEYRTASSVALCWLHQVLDADPTLTPHLRNEFNNNTAHNLDRYVCDWEENHIVDLWQKMISTVAKEVGFLVFIVDGLDKCNDPQVLQDLVNWVAQAAKKPDTILGGVQFQLLIFSNDTEKLRPLNHPPIHQLAAGRFLDDIKCAVRDRVDETLRRYESSGGQTDRVNQCEGEDQQDGEAGGGASSKLGKLLWNTVAEGEEKTHLWATVLMGEIKAANFPDKASLVSFLELLNRSPRGGKLDALYGAIVRRISSGRELKRHSFNMLFWLMHKIGIMTQQELQEGCGMLDAAGFRGADDGDRDTQRRIEETDIERTYLGYSTFRRALENLGGLVKIWRRGLCLIHDSFWDYFTTRADTAVHRDYRCSPKTAARVITRLCMDYLLLSRFKNAGPPATEGDSRQWENKVHKRVQENKFVRYASLRWTEHLQRSGSVFDPRHTSHKKLSRMRKLLDPRKGYMKSWTEVLWYWTKAAEGLPYPKERFPWELFVWKNPKGHWQPEQTSPPLRFSPPSFGNPESEQPQAASRQPDVERPGLEQVQADVEQPGSEQVQADVEQHGSEHPDPQQPTLEQPPSEWQIEGKNPKAWWRKKRVWLVVFALVIIIISGTVGGILGSRRSG